jgi:hypothetical protein
MATTNLLTINRDGLSERKREANRRNAQLSTGPTTERGKSISRLNAFKHGLLARTVPLPTSIYFGGEEEKGFTEARDSLYADYRPKGKIEEILVERIAGIYLRLSRLHRYENAKAIIAAQEEAQVLAAAGGSAADEVAALDEDIAESKHLDYLTDLHNRFRKALSNGPIPAELMEELHACVPPQHYLLLHKLRARITNLVSSNDDDNDTLGEVEKQEAIMRKVSDSAINMAKHMTLEKMWNRRLSSARFEQRLFPDEGVLRNIVRYESMLDRELHRCVDQLERQQKTRQARARLDSGVVAEGSDTTTGESSPES